MTQSYGSTVTASSVTMIARPPKSLLQGQPLWVVPVPLGMKNRLVPSWKLILGNLPLSTLWANHNHQEQNTGD
jgi:hypothetical protein